MVNCCSIHFEGYYDPVTMTLYNCLLYMTRGSVEKAFQSQWFQILTCVCLLHRTLVFLADRGSVGWWHLVTQSVTLWTPLDLSEIPAMCRFCMLIFLPRKLMGCCLTFGLVGSTISAWSRTMHFFHLGEQLDFCWNHHLISQIPLEQGPLPVWYV